MLISERRLRELRDAVTALWPEKAVPDTVSRPAKKRLRNTFLVLTGTTCILVAGQAHSEAIIGTTDLADATSTVGFHEPVLSGWDGDLIPLPDGVGVNDQFIEFGVQFRTGAVAGSSPLFTRSLPETFQVNGRVLVNDYGAYECQNTTQGCPSFKILFTSPVEAASFHMITRSGTSTFRAYLGGEWVGGFTAETAGLGRAGSATNFVFGFSGILFDEILVVPGGLGKEAVIDTVQFRLPSTAPDSDGDGISDGDDNCQQTPNPAQADNDLDGLGDACDNDDDNDGVLDNAPDNCPLDMNVEQTDTDGDGVGDVCDPDDDNDGDPDGADNCPLASNADQTDNDSDGAGDVCDDDDDNDGVFDNAPDNCPLVANADQTDTDGDGYGDSCDADLDGDGVANPEDNCPNAANVDQTDTDNDGAGDECDTDDDDDGIEDGNDNCPSVVNPEQEDLDGDGIGDACDADLDGDGFGNQKDNCPIDFNDGQDDSDGDGDGDECDGDDDNDSVLDDDDNCPLVANTDQSDVDGDGRGDICDADLDGDGVDNAFDNCLNIANSSQNDFDQDGIGDACDDDSDGDAVSNAEDQCPATPAGDLVHPDNGCSIAQLSPCEGPRGTTLPWRNHGKYVSSVAHAANEFVSQGLISEAEKDSIMSAAGESDCGARK